MTHGFRADLLVVIFLRIPSNSLVNLRFITFLSFAIHFKPAGYIYIYDIPAKQESPLDTMSDLSRGLNRNNPPTRPESASLSEFFYPRTSVRLTGLSMGDFYPRQLILSFRLNSRHFVNSWNRLSGGFITTYSCTLSSFLRPMLFSISLSLST